MVNSLKTIFISLTVLLLILFTINFSLISYLISQNKGFGVSVDHAGRLRFNSQIYAKLSSYYYLKRCLNQEAPLEVETIKQKLEESKKIVALAFGVLKEGKEGGRSVDKVSDPRAKELLSNAENHYQKAYSLFSALEACDPKALPQIEAETASALKNAHELTPLMAQEAKKSLLILQILTACFMIFNFFILGFLTRIIYYKLQRDLFHTERVLTEYTQGNLENEPPMSKIKELIPLRDGLLLLRTVLNNVFHSFKIQGNVTQETSQTVLTEMSSLPEVERQITALVEASATRTTEINDLLSAVEQATEDMKKAIHEISKNTQSTANKASKVKETANEMIVSVQELSGFTDSIKTFTETIRGIAEQTNFLALNASIEAARAGEAGKGFAVVANEVKELAKKTTDFTQEIDNIIAQLISHVDTVTGNSQRTLEMVKEVEEAAQVIASAVEEQTIVTNTIVEHLSNTKEKSFSLVSEIESLNKAAELLNKIANDLVFTMDSLKELSSTQQLMSNLFKISISTLTDAELNKLSNPALLNLALLGHFNWKINFLKDLLNGNVPKVERDHRRCLLGRSFHVIMNRAKKLEAKKVVDALNELEGPHAKLHALVERVEREVNLQDKKRILEFIHHEVVPIFAQVINLILRARDECRELGC